jgi:hypothetical protein
MIVGAELSDDGENDLHAGGMSAEQRFAGGAVEFDRRD